jgi:ketosteroid isomerase-like protein
MSQENVEVVTRFYAAWSRGELPGPTELIDPEIEYVNPTGAVEPGTRHGLAEFSRAVKQIFEIWDSWQIEIEALRLAGDQVAVVTRYRARVHGSGADMEARPSALWTLRDGKVVRYAWFHAPDDAFRAAGLSE